MSNCLLVLLMPGSRKSVRDTDTASSLCSMPALFNANICLIRARASNRTPVRVILLPVMLIHLPTLPWAELSVRGSQRAIVK